jgi:hypothetical protein
MKALNPGLVFDGLVFCLTASLHRSTAGMTITGRILMNADLKLDTTLKFLSVSSWKIWERFAAQSVAPLLVAIIVSIVFCPGSQSG